MAKHNIFTYAGTFPVYGSFNPATAEIDDTGGEPFATHVLEGPGDVRSYSRTAPSVVATEDLKQEVLPAVANEAGLLTLTYGTDTASGQVKLGDEVPVGAGADTRWFKFSGSSQTDVANAAMWEEISPTTPLGARYAGSSTTMAGAPTNIQGDAAFPIAAKDSFFLSADDVGTGTPAAPQFPRGWYVRNAANSAWVQSARDPVAAGVSETISVAGLAADTWTPVVGTQITVATDCSVRDASGNMLTEAVQSRIVGGVVSIRSDSDLVDLRVTIYS